MGSFYSITTLAFTPTSYHDGRMLLVHSKLRHGMEIYSHDVLLLAQSSQYDSPSSSPFRRASRTSTGHGLILPAFSVSDREVAANAQKSTYLWMISIRKNHRPVLDWSLPFCSPASRSRVRLSYGLNSLFGILSYNTILGRLYSSIKVIIVAGKLPSISRMTARFRPYHIDRLT